MAPTNSFFFFVFPFIIQYYFLVYFLGKENNNIEEEGRGPQEARGIDKMPSHMSQ